MKTLGVWGVNDSFNGFCEKYSLNRRLWSTNSAADGDYMNYGNILHSSLLDDVDSLFLSNSLLDNTDT